METSPRSFISYSRSDGRAFAEDLEGKLQSEGIHAWRDLQDMGSGDILPQVLRAIEEAEHLVLILSKRALVSDWIKREWSHARMVGKMVSPVLADTTIKRGDLPPWIRREEVYDVANPERWTKLVRILQGSGKIKRAPYMPGDLPENFVPREIEYAALKNAVLTRQDNRTVGLTTALRGAGGYGKTTLANYLCHDPDVRFEFTDGIVRVEIGKERTEVEVTNIVNDLIERLDPNGKRPGYTNVVTASEYLGELIGEARLLLVIDDVWREAQLSPFLRGGPYCVRLVTTRLPDVLPTLHVPIKIDEMSDAEATKLISTGLPTETNPVARVRLGALAKRLENWAQALGMASRWIHGRVSLGEELTEAIERYEGRLKKRGLTGFDPKHAEQRDRAIGICIEVSLEDLDDNERARFGELAVLPEDENVPLHVIEALWAETASLDVDDTDDLARRVNGLSLLQNLDLGAKTLRLHDNMAWYLRDRVDPVGYRAVHAKMVKAFSKSCGGEWESLPKKETYAWKFLIYHLRAAGQDGEADRLLTNYAWIKAKLHVSGAGSLFGSYLPESENANVRLVGHAIALSVPALAADPSEFARQIYGRLGHFKSGIAAVLAAVGCKDAQFCPAPRWPMLTPPGPERLRLMGHNGIVTSASFAFDGHRLVTASDDGTAHVWDAESGEEIHVLSGVNSASFFPGGDRILTTSPDETVRVWDAKSGSEIHVLRCRAHAVHSASFSSDGRRIVATSDHKKVARVWDAESGEEHCVLRGHEGRVHSASFSFDGNRIVTVSSDQTARVWDAESGEEIRVLRGHNDEVNSASFSPNGRCIVTASDDETARVWDAKTGEEIRVLRGHDRAVNTASFSPDGRHIVTAAHDQTARVWDAESGEEIRVLRGHGHALNTASFSSDGVRIVTASWDGSARVWDVENFGETGVLRGHDNWVNSVSFSSDASRIVTASRDATVRLWDAGSGEEIRMLRGHDNWVNNASFSFDGMRIVTASDDETARVWDARSGEEIHALRGHDRAVNSASFSPDGRRIVTAAHDQTARVWDAESGEELRVLHGHDEMIRSASFSPDGRRIVTAAHDQTARVWDAESGEELRVLYGHGGAVRRAAFSLDGHRLVTASDDGTARLWDAKSGEEIARITLDAGIDALAVSRIAIALGDRLGRIHVFDADPYLNDKEPRRA